MAKKKKTTPTNPNQIIEVVAIKEMTIAEYNLTVSPFKSKGWSIQGYEIGFRNNTNEFKKEITQ